MGLDFFLFFLVGGYKTPHKYSAIRFLYVKELGPLPFGALWLESLLAILSSSLSLALFTYKVTNSSPYSFSNVHIYT